ncbi:MAG: hypothetical protein GC155_18845 [Alphaproteobacteria bacterium]|nr:hypothetical protein [Alphaproteobacteria bacterium]
MTLLRRAGTLSLLLFPLLCACEDKSAPRVALSSHVAENNPNRGSLWPILLQHCLRNPSCDPMGKFGEGAGQASGVVGAVTYFVESADVVKEGGKDYGGRITLSMIGPRGYGGKAGRPLTLDETPADLRATRKRESWLSIEYREPSGTPEPYFLAFRSAQLALTVPGADTAKTQAAMMNRTGDYVAGLTWAGAANHDADGAKIEIQGKAGVLLTGYSIGMPSDTPSPNEEAVARGYEPWMFYISRNLRDDRAELAGLMKAIESGETLSLVISSPGGVILKDSIYTVGFSDALKAASAAMTDPKLALAIPERCAAFTGKESSDWANLHVSPAEQTCDPRTPDQKQTVEAVKPVQ